MPALGYYSTSKHALEGLTEALSQEVAPLGIKVLSIQQSSSTPVSSNAICEARRSTPMTLPRTRSSECIQNDKDGVYAPGDPDRMAEILVNLVKSGDMLVIIAGDMPSG